MGSAIGSQKTAQIAAATLRERLPEALRLVAIRERDLYGETSAEEIQAIRDSYTTFVEYCERIEKLTGQPVTVVARF